MEFAIGVPFDFFSKFGSLKSAANRKKKKSAADQLLSYVTTGTKLVKGHLRVSFPIFHVLVCTNFTVRLSSATSLKVLVALAKVCILVFRLLFGRMLD
jgi:uncharacterized membrane protein affecting hemolysin expression